MVRPHVREPSPPLIPATTAWQMTAVVAACLAIRCLATFVPGNWLWGLDTLRVWPMPWAIALALLAAAGFIPAVAQRPEDGL